MTDDNATVHATAVLVGRHAILLRGPAGAGKSRLAFDLLNAAQAGVLPFARLIADDRVHLRAANGRLLASPPATLAGLIEIHGLGIRRMAYEPVAVVGTVVDLAASDAARMPLESSAATTISGIRLPRLAVAAGGDGFAHILGALRSERAAR